ncbi:hypothetical protein GCM10010405_07860 [Streptomyces macrosporus]|uniref:Uncharacterized protein n=1 Tax=Streptomyces macrosporus TaxID=44032 RepID=A0ABP5WI19_9ACTN
MESAPPLSGHPETAHPRYRNLTQRKNSTIGMSTRQKTARPEEITHDTSHMIMEISLEKPSERFDIVWRSRRADSPRNASQCTPALIE